MVIYTKLFLYSRAAPGAGLAVDIRPVTHTPRHSSNDNIADGSQDLNQVHFQTRSEIIHKISMLVTITNSNQAELFQTKQSNSCRKNDSRQGGHGG